MAPAIHVDGLTKDYGRLRALDGLTLDVQDGEVLGFLGPNGAGKTTTIRLLLDLIRPTARIGRHRRLRLPPAEPRGQAPRRLPARRDARLPGTDRRGLPRLSRPRSAPSAPDAPGRRAPAEPVRPRRARPEAADAGPVARHEAEVRHRPGADDAAEGGHPRRADQRPRPADDRGVRRDDRRAEARGADDGVPLVARAVGSGEDVRPGGASSATAASLAVESVSEIRDIAARAASPCASRTGGAVPPPETAGDPGGVFRPRPNGCSR